MARESIWQWLWCLLRLCLLMEDMCCCLLDCLVSFWWRDDNASPVAKDHSLAVLTSSLWALASTGAVLLAAGHHRPKTFQVSLSGSQVLEINLGRNGASIPSVCFFTTMSNARSFLALWGMQEGSWFSHCALQPGLLNHKGKKKKR